MPDRSFDPGRVAIVSFDLDGTLLHSLAAWREGFARVFAPVAEREAGLAALGDPPTVHDGVFQRYMGEAHRAAGGGEWSEEFVRQAWRELLARHARRDDALADELHVAYQSTWPALLTLFDGAREVVERVRRRYPVVLVTNGNASYQRMKIERTGLESLFDSIVVSEEVGLLKPDPAIFHHAVAGLDGSEGMHVGDTPAQDIAGAIAAGWQAVWVSPSEHATCEPEPHARVRHIRELPALLGLEGAQTR